MKIFHNINIKQLYIMKKALLFIIALTLGTSSFAQKKGFEICTEFNAGLGLDEYQKYTFGTGIVSGYRFNKILYVGVGVGYEYLKGLYYHSYEYVSGTIGSLKHNSYDVSNNFQFYGRITANLSSSKVSPFLSFDIGHNLSMAHNEIKMANGPFVEPAIGIEYRLNGLQSLYFMAGYNYQVYQYKSYDMTTYSDGWSDNITIKDVMSCKLCFRVGIKI